jgi:hypothetical protein
MHITFQLKKLKGRDYSEDLGVDGDDKGKGKVVPVLNQAPCHEDV